MKDKRHINSQMVRRWLMQDVDYETAMFLAFDTIAEMMNDVNMVEDNRNSLEGFLDSESEEL